MKYPKPISNFKKYFSSAICVDIRNSTYLVRQYDEKQLEFHAEFLLDIKTILFGNAKIIKEISLNDTGDGFICLFWNETHSWTALYFATIFREYLMSNKDKYSDFLHKNNINGEFNFGIGIHTASSLIYRFERKNLKRDFMFGKVLNSSQRMESFTKKFKKINLLMSEYFIYALEKQTPIFNHNRKKSIKFSQFYKDNIKEVINEKVDIDDSHPTGHALYTVKKDNKIRALFK